MSCPLDASPLGAWLPRPCRCGFPAQRHAGAGRVKRTSWVISTKTGSNNEYLRPLLLPSFLFPILSSNLDPRMASNTYLFPSRIKERESPGPSSLPALRMVLLLSLTLVCVYLRIHCVHLHCTLLYTHPRPHALFYPPPFPLAFPHPRQKQW